MAIEIVRERWFKDNRTSTPLVGCWRPSFNTVREDAKLVETQAVMFSYAPDLGRALAHIVTTHEAGDETAFAEAIRAGAQILNAVRSAIRLATKENDATGNDDSAARASISRDDSGGRQAEPESESPTRGEQSAA